MPGKTVLIDFVKCEKEITKVRWIHFCSFIEPRARPGMGKTCFFYEKLQADEFGDLSVFVQLPLI
jgi:hypothetical protein